MKEEFGLLDVYIEIGNWDTKDKYHSVEKEANKALCGVKVPTYKYRKNFQINYGDNNSISIAIGEECPNCEKNKKRDYGI